MGAISRAEYWRVARGAPWRGPLRLAAAADGEGGESDGVRSAPDPREREDLPYRVEIWNRAGTSVEQVLAVTANASIGYAAYYAATREFPERYITLRHKKDVISRWNAGRQ